VEFVWNDSKSVEYADLAITSLQKYLTSLKNVLCDCYYRSWVTTIVAFNLICFRTIFHTYSRKKIESIR